ncbi:MAG: type VI secretion system baseplate subunit TssF, partial [Aeromonadaceae bacterium]|nr:type VI secretion system baseplate subunit TssF [Aeromonadaceae bacterium]
MRLEHYFQDELYRLRQQGGELAAAFPSLCRYLGHAGADPDVERLLEGAAFLTATLRARIDDQFPELSQG